MYVLANVEPLCLYLCLLYGEGGLYFVYIDFKLLLFSSRKRVWAMGDLMHAWCVSFGRLRDPPYFVTMYLVSPWYIFPSWPWSSRAWISCLPRHVR